MRDILERLEEYRLENRISQEKLAGQLGVAFITVSRWLNGHNKPSKIQAYHLEKFLAQKGKKK